MRRIEQGNLSVAIGSVFDCAALVGVELFYDDERRVIDEAQRQQATVIGRRVRTTTTPEIDLEF